MKTINISIYHRIDDTESWMVSDDGGEFDDSEEYATAREANDDAEGRHDHYVAADPTVRVVTTVK